MFSITEVASWHKKTIVHPDNTAVFQEGRMRKQGKMKAQFSLSKSFLDTLSVMAFAYILLDAKEIGKFNLLFSYLLHWIKSDSVSKKYTIHIE